MYKRQDSSYGVHVADLAGIPNEVIQRAQLLLNTSDHFYQAKSIIPQTVTKPEVSRSNESREALIEKLQNITPDSITPREALETLYELLEDVDQLQA